MAKKKTRESRAAAAETAPAAAETPTTAHQPAEAAPATSLRDWRPDRDAVFRVLAALAMFATGIYSLSENPAAGVVLPIALCASAVAYALLEGAPHRWLRAMAWGWFVTSIAPIGAVLVVMPG